MNSLCLLAAVSILAAFVVVTSTATATATAQSPSIVLNGENDKLELELEPELEPLGSAAKKCIALGQRCNLLQIPNGCCSGRCVRQTVINYGKCVSRRPL